MSAEVKSDIFDTTVGEGKKALWLVQGRYQLSMQIGMDGDGENAYFGVEDTGVDSTGHEVALGVSGGEPFLQVARGDTVVRLDLLAAAKVLQKLIDESKPA